ncbi:MAG: hypothetical protein AMJ53_17270 [Gammaproteobacteria bacterium SG8_11]|nr:MAG: hypothetical protein AMJ53_17270 [Gammaproteobacteria bacterium SG8_11]
MHDLNPLYLVGFSIVTLWLIGKILARAAKRISNVQSLRRRAQILKKTSIEIVPGLHVGGLDERLSNELSGLMNKKDELKTAIFLAIHRPIFYEIEDFIDKLREQFTFLVGVNADEASEFDKISAANSLQIPQHPQTFRFNKLNRSELRMLYEYDPDTLPVIDKELIDKFGGLLFLENFIMYDHLCLEKPAIFHIPKDNELRRLFETFTKNGLALQGKDISLRDRLYVLNLEQLQDLAKEVKITREFKNKAEATAALAEIPSSSVLLSTIYPASELFLLVDEPRDVKKIEREWGVLSLYAKLLCAESLDAKG